MFYSHEILTSRKHGVATIWLVATLGSKSQLKKVTRKAILDVDVSKACETIIDPNAPMALRLQGNLLYGVSRVYSQQCGYVLTDLQSFRDKIRSFEVVAKEAEIDPEAGRARPDQLNLADDPAFQPELDLEFDLSLFDIPRSSSRASSLLSPLASLSSRSSLHIKQYGTEEPVLVFPSADTPGGSVGFGFGGGYVTGSAVRSGSDLLRNTLFEESAIIEEPLFEIGPDGGAIELPTAIERNQQSETPNPGVDGGLVGDTRITVRIEAEDDGDQQFGQPEPDLPDDGFVFPIDDDPILPHAQPFSPREGKRITKSGETSSVLPDDSSSTADAPQRRARPPKRLVFDRRTELTNKELSDWNSHYLANMKTATRVKEQNKSHTHAKKEAAFWVLGHGIGGGGTNFAHDRMVHPLSVFSGQALLDALTGQETSPAGHKRSRSMSAEDEEDEKGRRVRERRNDKDQLGRPEDDTFQLIGGDDDGFVIQGDDMPPSEVGRNAPSSLPDRTSMPWNPSGSRQGSLQRFGSVLPGVSSSVGGAVGGLDLGPPLARTRRVSRLTSASPLLGKSTTHLPRLSRVSSLDILSQHRRTSSDLDYDDPEEIADVQLGLGVDDDGHFELYGPAAAVNTQQAVQSQWVNTVLENEAHNFLLFLDHRIKEKEESAEDAADIEEAGNITLDKLLPPDQNNNIVAAQALLHVLALATKGLITVEQSEAFGDIKLGIVGEVIGHEVEEAEGMEGTPSVA